MPKRHHVGKQRVIVPVNDLNAATAAAVDYALSITTANRITAVHVNVDSDDKREATLPERWKQWAPDVELRLITSPYRELISPVIELIDACHVCLLYTSRPSRACHRGCRTWDPRLRSAWTVSRRGDSGWTRIHSVRLRRTLLAPRPRRRCPGR